MIVVQTMQLRRDLLNKKYTVRYTMPYSDAQELLFLLTWVNWPNPL